MMMVLYTNHAIKNQTSIHLFCFASHHAINLSRRLDSPLWWGPCPPRNHRKRALQSVHDGLFHFILYCLVGCDYACAQSGPECPTVFLYCGRVGKIAGADGLVWEKVDSLSLFIIVQKIICSFRETSVVSMFSSFIRWIHKMREEPM